jgi:hypothetical protein
VVASRLNPLAPGQAPVLLEPTRCSRWSVKGPWAISQSNGFLIKFDMRQKHDSLMGTADNGSGPVPLIGTLVGNQLTLTVSWAGG